MAWIEKHPTSGHFKICFRVGQRKIKKTLRTTKRKEADAALARLEENLRLVERGRIEVPAGADLAVFLLSDGKITSNSILLAVPRPLTLGEICEAYIGVQSNGALETNSLDTLRMHLRHIRKTIGDPFQVAKLEIGHLQGHIDRRAKKQYRGRSLRAATLRKEIANFRACWNWGVQTGNLNGVFPNRGLKFPKSDEKPPFQTKAEIERQIARGGLTAVQVRELWDCLILTRPEIDELLREIHDSPGQPFLYPMVCLAAHSGARRSELLRLSIDDLDLTTGTMLLHEKKRTRGRRTNRRVPLSGFVQTVLKDWLDVHPGGQQLFCQGKVVRSKSRRNEPIPVTRNEAHDHLRRALEKTSWAKLRGWHAFRHSFASNCAAAGIDQRVINEWMGHQTEEMVRRYRHLFPDQQRKAINLVFG